MDLKLKDFVDENDLQKLVELDNIIERVRTDYVNAAKELAKGLKLNVEGVADLEKLSNLYNTQCHHGNCPHCAHPAHHLRWHP